MIGSNYRVYGFGSNGKYYYMTDIEEGSWGNLYVYGAPYHYIYGMDRSKNLFWEIGSVDMRTVTPPTYLLTDNQSWDSYRRVFYGFRMDCYRETDVCHFMDGYYNFRFKRDRSS